MRERRARSGETSVAIHWHESPANVCDVVVTDFVGDESWFRAELLGLNQQPSVPELLANIDPANTLSTWLKKDQEIYFPATRDIWGELIPSVLGQRITSREAALQWRRLYEFTGKLDPERIANLSSADFHTLGIERARASVLHVCAKSFDRIQVLNNATVEDAYSQLSSIPGLGPWTLAETLRRSHGWRDAVSTGDFHLKKDVVFALTGARNGSDQQMLELLEPFRPYRAVVVAAVRAHAQGHQRHAPGLRTPDIRKL